MVSGYLTEIITASVRTRVHRRALRSSHVYTCTRLLSLFSLKEGSAAPQRPVQLSLHLPLADDSTTIAGHQPAYPLPQGGLQATPLPMRAKLWTRATVRNRCKPRLQMCAFRMVCQEDCRCVHMGGVLRLLGLCFVLSNQCM